MQYIKLHRIKNKILISKGEYMKLLIMMLFGLLLSGCNPKEVIYTDDSNSFLEVSTKTVEVYSDLFLNDVFNIKNDNIKIISENYQLDTTSLGKHQYEIYYQYNNKKYVYKDYIDVVDTTPPLVFSGTNKTVNINYDKDMCNLITYGDNYTGNVKCEIKGSYDLQKVGTYKLIYNLTDSSNNTKTVNVTLNVVSKISDNQATNKVKVPFQEVYNNYKNNNTEIGIDVSKWQEDIDFEQVKKAGASFVMIRLGVDNLPNHQILIDEYYQNNIKKAKEAGLKVGVYFHSIATSKKEAIEQANFVIKTLDGKHLDLPVAFDWESWADWNSFKISFYEINDIANTFLKEITKAGYQGMLYGSKFYLETIWTNKEQYPVWLAHYTNKTNYDNNYVMWQLCNNGRIAGINGDVDIDIMYK